MNEIAQQTVIFICVLAVAFAGPVIALNILILRKRRARARRRSPVSIELLRGPGHTLRNQLDEAQTDLTFDIFLLMIIPLMGMALVLAQSHVRGSGSLGRSALIYAALAAVFIAYMGHKMWRASVRRDALKAGYDAELAVGQELDQLMRQGAYVFHDFPADHFNIDHVVIAPHGVFAVETKGYTKPIDKQGQVKFKVAFDGEVLRFPTFATREPIEQAERQADWLAKWLSSATGSSTHVLPVLALRGWFVELRGVSRVRVFNGRQLPQLLHSLGATRLTELDLQRIVHQVQQRCRTVMPKYSEVERAG